MSLYCYVVHLFNWDGAAIQLLFHEKKYSRDEFYDICRQIDNIVGLEGDEYLDLEDFIDIAKKEFGFKRLEIYQYDILDSKVVKAFDWGK